jgi:hypothetical protein
MADPPFELGAVNVTEACVLPGVAVPIVGAPGTTAATVKLWVTVGAASVLPLPAWSALIVQVPLVINVRDPLLVMVQTPAVEELNVGVKLELALADNVGVVPKFWVPGLGKVMVWVAL